IVPFVGNSAIRANGDTRTPAALMTTMVILNVILDPLLIFGAGPIPALGIQGAALATVIARGLSLVIGLLVLQRNQMLTREIPTWPQVIQSWKGILYVGLPAAATNLVVPLTTALITNLVSTYGEDAVAALGVASRVDLLAIMVVVALSSVLGPFVGQNLGAKKWERLRVGINHSQRFGLLWGLLMLVIIWTAREPIARIFTQSDEVVAALSLYLSIVPFGYAFRCIYALDNTILNVLNRPLVASGITISMMFGVYLPLAYLGSEFFELPGVFASIALAYAAGGSASYLWVKKCLNQANQAPEEVTQAAENGKPDGDELKGEKVRELKS
ncbi:MAG: MATE family efflux transporter, partial [Bacteroidota bacterium]